MRGIRPRVLIAVAGAVSALAVAAMFGSDALASAAPAAVPAQAGASVSSVPADGTPALPLTGPTEQIRQLVQCGPTMFAVGSFTTIKQGANGNKNITRDNVFSFSATAPYTVTAWNPGTNGPVNTIALSPDCATAYLGGDFTQAGGAAASDIAALSTSSGTPVPGWRTDANGEVDTLALAPNGQLLAGGSFKGINGGPERFYASLNPATGAATSYLNLKIRGSYVIPRAKINTTEIYNQQISPDGQYVLAEGVFRRVERHNRSQIFMLHLGASHGSVTNWYSPEFQSNCASNHPFYVHTAAWSPDGATVYVADTGFHPENWKTGTFPFTGLCDAVAAFPSTHDSGLKHEWANYTGCDSLFSIAAGASAVYVGGHERWANDASGCNDAGPGAFPSPGMTGLTTAGQLLLNPAGTAGLYSRDRGMGADDMLLTSAGLWIASDNFQRSQNCGGVPGHSGICFLPNG